MLSDFIEVGFQVGQLLLELATMICQHGLNFAQLHTGIARAVIQVNDFFGLAQ